MSQTVGRQTFTPNFPTTHHLTHGGTQAQTARATCWLHLARRLHRCSLTRLVPARTFRAKRLRGKAHVLVDSVTHEHQDRWTDHQQRWDQSGSTTQETLDRWPNPQKLLDRRLAIRTVVRVPVIGLEPGFSHGSHNPQPRPYWGRRDNASPFALAAIPASVWNRLSRQGTPEPLNLRVYERRSFLSDHPSTR